MQQEQRQKLVKIFKDAISYEEFNLVKAQNDCMRDWQRIFKGKKEREEGEEILDKLIVDSLSHAVVFTNLIIKLYEEEL